MWTHVFEILLLSFGRHDPRQLLSDAQSRTEQVSEDPRDRLVDLQTSVQDGSNGFVECFGHRHQACQTAEPSFLHQVGDEQPGTLGAQRSIRPLVRRSNRGIGAA